jgi:hypothetical protein
VTQLSVPHTSEKGIDEEADGLDDGLMWEDRLGGRRSI